MSKPNKYSPQQRQQPPAPSVPALPPAVAAHAEGPAQPPAASITDALGPAPEIDVDLAPLGVDDATSDETPPPDPLDDVRGPDAPPPADETPAKLRAFRAVQDAVFSYAGHGLAVRRGKVYTEERYGAAAMDLMAKSKVFELVES